MSKNFRISPTILQILTILSLLLGSAIFPSPVLADSIITVNTNTDELNTDGDCSLREAIEAANTDAAVDACTAGSGPDTITLPSGTYTLTIAGDEENANATGDLDITDTMVMSGASSGNTIIQAGTDPGLGMDRVFDVIGAIQLDISNVTIANGTCITCDGGGIFNDGGVINVTNSIFSGNSGDNTLSWGGGIYNFGGNLTLTNTTFVGNSAMCGGGIYNDLGTVTVINSSFSGNIVECEGGGIYNSGTLTVTGSSFVDNSAHYGGGISNFNGAATVTNSTFSNNAALYEGGGIDNLGILRVTNNTFSENSADGFGGGIYNGAVLYLKNTILANSLIGDDCYNESGNSISSNINNLIETNGPDGNMCGTPTSTADPMLGTLTGSPSYFPLNIASPAFDTGSDAVCVATPVNNTSQNGVTRPNGLHCDIGSFEKSPAFLDVPYNYWANASIERLFDAGITGGCSSVPMNYCPDNTVTRDQMAVFLERGLHGSSFFPRNVSPTFNDTAGNFAEDWIEALKNDGITSGCGTNIYCPSQGVTRAQMAIFLERAMHGASFTPPNVTPTFNDTAGNFAEDWIEALKNDGITSGCGGNNYCPDATVTRAQMAVFLVKAFNLP